MPGGAAWMKRYNEKDPGVFQIYGPFTYDAAMVLADAMQRAGSSDPKVYIPFLQKTDYQGVTQHIQFEANGELKNASITLWHYVDGKLAALN
jgi:branched-chain amino acid transport system substrate-binding protein